MSEEDIKLFTCYSKNLVHFLKEKGIKYRITGFNVKTNKQFYVFIRTEKLNKVLDEWRISKPN